jgi:hypothetical protein
MSDKFSDGARAARDRADRWLSFVAAGIGRPAVLRLRRSKVAGGHLWGRISPSPRDRIHLSWLPWGRPLSAALHRTEGQAFLGELLVAGTSILSSERGARFDRSVMHGGSREGVRKSRTCWSALETSPPRRPRGEAVPGVVSSKGKVGV